MLGTVENTDPECIFVSAQVDGHQSFGLTRDQYAYLILDPDCTLNELDRLSSRPIIVDYKHPHPEACAKKTRKFLSLHSN